MARIELLKVEEMNQEQRQQYDEFPSNLARGLLVTKNLSKGYGALGTALRFTDLSANDREFVIVRVGFLSGSAYELMQHKTLAMLQGWTEEDIKAVADNNISYFDDRMATILQFVNECVERVKVSNEVFARTRNFLTDSEIAELTLLIGHYMMTARFLETLEIDLDSKPTSWENVELKK